MIEECEHQKNIAMTESSSGATQAAKRAKGDPRDQDFVIKYDKGNFSKGDQEGGLAEFYQLISVVIGMVAFLTR